MEDLCKPEAQRLVIAFLTFEGSTPTEIHLRLHSILEDAALSRSQVFFWVKQFKEGRSSVGDEERAGRPVTAATVDFVNEVQCMVQEDRRCTISEMVHELRLTRGTVYRILKDHLKLSKLSARWVPRLLTSDQKSRRVVCSQENLQMAISEGDTFWERLITTDETWLPFFTPETKEDSKQWLRKGSTPPVKAKSSPMQRKIMLTAFWDQQGIIHLDFLPDNETINSEYYCQVLEDVHHHLRHRRRGKKSKGILLQQDNARPHTARRTIEKIEHLRWKLIPHPPYSPDLAPSDYALFPHMKQFLRGRRFSTREELETEARSVLQSIPPQWFYESIRKLQDRWQKCVSSGGDYVEKTVVPPEDE